MDRENDTLRCLFLNGPTLDGDVPSKQQRDELIARGAAYRCDGWTQLTELGLQISLGVGFGIDKEKRDRERAVTDEKRLIATQALGMALSLIYMPAGRMHLIDETLLGNATQVAEAAITHARR